MFLRHIEPHVRANIDADIPTLLLSQPGLGKTTWSRSLYQKLKSEGAAVGIKWGYQEFFPATANPTDLIGAQYKGSVTYQDKTYTISDPAMPIWFVSDEGIPASHYDKYFLLIEEYGQGDADVKRVLPNLLLEGRIGPWKLPPGSVRIGTTNMDSRDGVSKDFDFAINRRSHVPVQPDLESLLAYSDLPYQRGGRTWLVTSPTKVFMKRHPEVVFEEKPKAQGPWCTPRSLVDFDRYIQCYFSGKEVNPSDPGIMEMGAGIIGQAATQGYVGFLQFALELPDYHDIVADPVGTPTPTKPDLQMMLAYELAALSHAQDLPQIVTYMQRLPKDLAVTYITSLIRRMPKMINEPAIAAWTQKNSTLLSLVVSLA